MIRRRLTFANVISVVALFVALGGASYAATQLPRGSVGTKQLKNGAVTNAKVRAGSLTAAAFGAGQIPAGPAGPTGPRGERGPKGEKGDTGDRGLPGESVPQTISAVIRYGSYVTVPANEPGRTYAACAPGEAATGGGYDVGNTIPPEKWRLWVMRPSDVGPGPTYPPPASGDAATGYYVYLENKTASAFEFRAYAVCVKTS